VWTARTAAAATSDTLNLQFNGDTGSNYDRQLMSAAATTVSASEALAQTSAAIANCSGNTAPAGASGGGEIVFPSYADTTFNKTATSRYTYVTGTATGTVLSRQIGINWRSTAAITSIVLTASGNFSAGSKFQLYGIP
jgi:hypothetical protein